MVSDVAETSCTSFFEGARLILAFPHRFGDCGSKLLLKELCGVAVRRSLARANAGKRDPPTAPSTLAAMRKLTSR